MKISTTILAIFATILMNACATVKPNNHIDLTARPFIEKSDAYVMVPQDELYAQIKNSNVSTFMGGGLIPALIDASVDNARTKKAEELIGTINNKLLEFDYANYAQEEIENKLGGVSWLGLDKVQLERKREGNDFFVSTMENSQASAVLYLAVGYSLTPDFDAVTTKVAALMFPKSEGLMAFREKPKDSKKLNETNDNIYRNTFSNTVNLGLMGDREENAATLANSDGQVIRDALLENIEVIANAIRADIELGEPVEE